jgi:hypothetical protein
LIAEDTGPMIRATMVETIEDGGVRQFIGDIVRSAIAEGSGGGIPPEMHLKKIRRGNWGAVLAAILAAGAGVLGSYYATEARSKANEEKANVQEVQINEHDAAIRENARAVVQIKFKIDEVADQSAEISAGIKELKAESVDTLKRELRDARRELRGQ